MTQTEWLMEFWGEVYKGDYDRYDLLKIASTIRWKDEPLPRKHLKARRNQFEINHVFRHKFPKASYCFLSEFHTEPNRILVRHHILSLKGWGCNRRINVVTLCDKCHLYFHPWIKRLSHD